VRFCDGAASQVPLVTSQSTASHRVLYLWPLGKFRSKGTSRKGVRPTAAITGTSEKSSGGRTQPTRLSIGTCRLLSWRGDDAQALFDPSQDAYWVPRRLAEPVWISESTYWVAIQAGLTVFDLEEMELAYSPQYGSAKSINMAGFVAAGMLAAIIRKWTWSHPVLPPDQRPMLLDVRT
jgi:hypothetical protein